jgi:REP element-mobilizing transposase RayT
MSEQSFRVYRRHLPHYRSKNYPYFVTWRLERDQQALNDEEREVVADSIRFFSGKRYDIEGFVIMDDHVHVVVLPHAGERLEQILHSWKSYTANRLQRDFQRSGIIWQNEYFDRLLRNDAELKEKLKYILRNPAKRWPGVDEYKWVWCVGM